VSLSIIYRHNGRALVYMTLVVTDSLLMKELELEAKPSCWFMLESLNILEDRPSIPIPSHSVITGVLRVLSPILLAVDLL